MKYETGKIWSFSRFPSNFTPRKRAEWSLAEKITSFCQIQSRGLREVKLAEDYRDRWGGIQDEEAIRGGE